MALRDRRKELMADYSHGAFRQNMPRMAFEQFSAAIRRWGIERGFLAVVYNPATRQKELAEVTPAYWKEKEAEGLK